MDKDGDHTGQKCENCRHWMTPEQVAERQFQLARHRVIALGHFGQCRRNPLLAPPHYREDYPTTTPSHWCEDWEAK